MIKFKDAKLSCKAIFLLPFIVLLLCVNNSYGVMLDDGVTPRDNAAKEQSQYVPGEVIIKLKENKNTDVLFTQSYSTRARDNNTRLSGIKSRHNLRDEKPVFKHLHDQLKARNLSQGVLNTEHDQKFRKGKARSPKPKEEPDLFPIYRLKTDKDIHETCRNLKQDPDIEYAEPNYIMKACMVPSDPYYSSAGSWGQSYDDLWGLKKIQCEQAWDLSQGEGVVVAVIDTGVDYNHSDIKDNMWDDGYGHCGYNFVNDTNDPMDDFGHGTHCAGTIAAVGNNNIGVIGVAPKAKIMAVKGLDNAGSGDTATLADCIRYAADNGAKVLSNSWGGSGSSQTLTDAFHYADSLGCVCIAAAGNSNADVSGFSPANIDTVIAVAATNQNDEKCDFSNY